MVRVYCIALVMIIGLAACAGNPAPTEDVSQSAAVMTGVAATLSAERETAPTLVNPPDGATFDNPAEVVLSWDWIRPLSGDEVYDVRVWREGAPHYGITWNGTSRFALVDWLRFQEPGEFFWSAAVIVGGEDGQVEREISQEAPARRFTVRANTLPTPTPIPVSSAIEVPPGFEARLYADVPLAGLPTTIAFGPDGALYMLNLSGDIFRLVDADGDDYAETVTRIYLDDQEKLNHAIGMAFHDGVMYVSDSGRISTFADSDGDGMLDTLTPIVEGLVSLRYPFHSNNGIAFAPDGKLYIGVGSTTDHGPIKNEMESLILRMNPDGSDLEVFARGFRNPYDLTFSPDGDLFMADNNPDEMDESLRWMPPEELNHVRQGLHYGFPDAYGSHLNGTDTTPPITEFFPSVASSGLVYYAADQFPARYRNGVFVSLWGTAAPTPQERSITNGRMVLFVPLEPTDDGTFQGDWEVFAWFDQQRDFRPIDLTVGDDGALYIAEWTTAGVYRVVYTGRQQAALPTPTQGAPATPADPAVIAAGEALYREGVQGAPSCITCHLLNPGEVGAGPSMLGLRDIAGGRVSGMDAATYVRRAITHPNEHIVSGYSAGYMFQDYEARMTDDQLDALVAYVLSLSGDE